MARLRLFTFLGIIFVSVLLFSSVQPTRPIAVIETNHIPSQVDTTPPNVYGWGIEGDPLLGEGFDVWANVTDDDSPLRNVSVQVNGPNMTLNNLLTFNTTFYTGSVPAFPNDGLFIVRIRAYDMAKNTRVSYYVRFDYETDIVIPIDPTLTMPYVVGSSIGLLALVIGLAIVYDRKKSPGERIMQPEYGSG